MLRQITLILDTPALPARYLERQSQWQAEITASSPGAPDWTPTPTCTPHSPQADPRPIPRAPRSRWRTSTSR
ncbi:hypothetical protein [Streptomyces xylophagus]|uniref:hypothetical protein n=1 Tax=Streptomyces xylophagus TaxID=285514 RepID=UPI000B1491F8|nr:hypothetical protein [Streptomyces xylophagus]